MTTNSDSLTCKRHSCVERGVTHTVNSTARRKLLSMTETLKLGGPRT
ncbi:hypothetical protein L798_02499 [Zootermopsis nevadensis]|uniref:Uncharacterized protein n=1 Tax=Zootermopsis nevadensis TaxID=136037 RepID=A0A067RF56_ZOONE|nr:hypothetical protein L798_02499 [Zootermopsis nevadensis]